MKTFDIITEADARVLSRGDSVALTRSGHITPLAQDTLRERRITVLREGAASVDEAALAPVAEIRTVAIASDHTGVALRRSLVLWLRGLGLTVLDLGIDGAPTVDYPDTAALVAESVAHREADAGIVIDGSGMGSAIAANKIRGIRAAMATTETMARYAREHNGTNVLALGATLVDEEQARSIAGTWLRTPMREPRYIRRLGKIRDLEERSGH
jgi:ribose 5-phosphate isomerase B